MHRAPWKRHLLEAERQRKTCPSCRTEKPFSEFYKRKDGTHGLDAWCGECSKTRTKQWRLANPEKSRSVSRNWQKRNPERFARLQRSKDLRIKYGITIEEWDNLLLEQNGNCAICGKPPRSIGGHGHYRMMVDHDHETGKIRGLVHSKCNLMLGYADDDIELLKKAILYLESKRM